jgi:hypothetical protein
MRSIRRQVQGCMRLPDGLRRLELDLKDPALVDDLPRTRQGRERGPVRRMGLEVCGQARLIGGAELPVEAADQQRVDVVAVHHGPGPYTTCVTDERRTREPWHDEHLALARAGLGAIRSCSKGTDAGPGTTI